MVCVAKADPRYYLEGVHITPKYIEATNGHVALRMEHGIKTRKNIIVKFDGPVPVKAETTELVFNKDPIAVHRDYNGLRISITATRLLDGRFPDLDRVIPTTINDSVIPAVQGEYMAYPAKMFGRERKFVPVKIAPSGETSGCRFLFDKAIGAAFGNPQFVVMPVRMGREDWSGGGA
ncbi:MULTISPECIES: hypothetical protein [Symbiopectobacterium]|uniref:hypothetical protein n=1 Tax=Candidatus Symbiopectobacterium sp. PLON1 TaxID=2794575 RepID=UPI002079D720|nr:MULTISPECIES: hypothetical protein [Symbiopectobacterium]